MLFLHQGCVLPEYEYIRKTVKKMPPPPEWKIGSSPHLFFPLFISYITVAFVYVKPGLFHIVTLEYILFHPLQLLISWILGLPVHYIMIPGIFPGTFVSSSWEITTFKPCPCFYCCVKYFKEKAYFRGFYHGCLTSMAVQKHFIKGVWPKKAAYHRTTRKQRVWEEGDRTKNPQRYTNKDLCLWNREQ